MTYPHPLAKAALEPTLGVALWQEQAMQLAIDCAGFTPGEADRLRKAMAAKHAPEKVAAMRERLLTGMAGRGIPPGRRRADHLDDRGVLRLRVPAVPRPVDGLA